MNLFRLGGNGFIVTLGAMLILSGAIMFYCVKRFSILEHSVCEQSKIIQSLLVNMQEPLEHMHNMQQPLEHMHNMPLANPVTVNAAKELDNLDKLNNLNNLENDDYSDYSDYTSESGSERGTNVINSVCANIANGDIKVIEIEEPALDGVCTSIDLSNSMIVDLAVAEPHLLEVSSSDTDSEINLENELEIELEIDNLGVDLHEPILLNNSKSIDELEINTSNIKKLKVADLRNLVKQKGLVESDTLQTLKKDGLIKLLQEN